MLLLQDRRLLEQFRRGDPAALAQVFDHYQPQVTRLIQGGFSFSSGGRRMRFSGFDHSADLFDLVHDVFRTAFQQKARESYGGVSPYGAYLATITRNVIVTRLRRMRNIPELESLEVAEQVQAPEPNPEQALARTQEHAVVREFLGTLNDFEQAFVKLRFDEELGQEHVAVQLGVGRKKVRLMEGSIRQRLNRFLVERGVFRAPRSAASLPPPAISWLEDAP